MKNPLKYLAGVLFAGLLAFTLSGCGGGDNTPTGPSGAAAFDGVTIDLNPTISFTAGNNLTYLNTEVGSPFPAADPAAAGTYTYVPNASFTAGTLTLTVTGIDDPIILEISNFVRTGTTITGFTARSGGVNYPVTVTGGTLTAYTPPAGGSGESRAPDVPASMQGSYELTFHISDTAPITGVPADGTVTTFVIGARTLTFNSRTLSNPIHYNGNPYEWIFKDGNIWWAVSQAVGGGLNEINVQGPYTGSGNAFYGQYNDGTNGIGGGYNSIGIGLNGGFVGGGFTANVTSVVGPTTMPSGSDLFVQSLTQGQTITVTFSNNGDLLSSDLVGVFNFTSADSTQAVYSQIRPGDSPAVADTITIYKNNDELPQSLVIYSVRTGQDRSTQVTYDLDVNVP